MGFLGKAKLLCTALNTVETADGIKHHYSIGSRGMMSRDAKHYQLYTIYDIQWDHDKHRWISHDIYSTGSLVRIVLYLRDIYDLAVGKELDYGDAQWNETRKLLISKGHFGGMLDG